MDPQKTSSPPPKRHKAETLPENKASLSQEAGKLRTGEKVEAVNPDPAMSKLDQPCTSQATKVETITVQADTVAMQEEECQTMEDVARIYNTTLQRLQRMHALGCDFSTKKETLEEELKDIYSIQNGFAKMSAYFYNQPEEEREIAIDYEDLHNIFEEINKSILRNIAHTENKDYQLACLQINDCTIETLHTLKEMLEKSNKYTKITSSQKALQTQSQNR